jgi:hypothetical protein
MFIKATPVSRDTITSRAVGKGAVPVGKSQWGKSQWGEAREANGNSEGNSPDGQDKWDYGNSHAMMGECALSILVC